jgi:predicted TPR repeat methyltransferase
MLELAKASGAYDELRRGELAAAMAAEPAAYDVIVAADVLIYFGALDEVLQAAARALRPGGLMALTLERHEGESYVLRSSGRYAHNPDYLRASAAQAGLTVLDVQECALRLELAQSIRGIIVLLQAPSD